MQSVHLISRPTPQTGSRPSNHLGFSKTHPQVDSIHLGARSTGPSFEQKKEWLRVLLKFEDKDFVTEARQTCPVVFQYGKSTPLTEEEMVNFLFSLVEQIVKLTNHTITAKTTLEQLAAYKKEYLTSIGAPEDEIWEGILIELADKNQSLKGTNKPVTLEIMRETYQATQAFEHSLRSLKPTNYQPPDVLLTPFLSSAERQPNCLTQFLQKTKLYNELDKPQEALKRPLQTIKMLMQNFLQKKENIDINKPPAPEALEKIKAKLQKELIKPDTEPRSCRSDSWLYLMDLYYAELIIAQNSDLMEKLKSRLPSIVANVLNNPTPKKPSQPEGPTTSIPDLLREPLTKKSKKGH